MKSPTRKEYMDKKVSFEAFYRAVNATAGVKISDPELIAKVKAALADGDEHLNSIPLPHWDMLAHSERHALARALKEHGDFYSLAGGVCCMKQAAKDAAA